MGRTVEVKTIYHVVDQDISIYWTDTNVTTGNYYQFNSLMLRRDSYMGNLRFLKNFSAAVCELWHILYCGSDLCTLVNTRRTHTLPISKPYTITLLPLSMNNISQGVASLMSLVHKSTSIPALTSYILIWPKWLITMRW